MALHAISNCAEGASWIGLDWADTQPRIQQRLSITSHRSTPAEEMLSYDFTSSFPLHWHERHRPGVRGWHAGTGNARMIPTAAILTSMRRPDEAESGHSRLVSATSHWEPVYPAHVILAKPHCGNIIASLHVSYNDTRTHIKHRSHFGSRYHIRLMRLASLFRLASDPEAEAPICWLPVGG